MRSTLSTLLLVFLSINASAAAKTPPDAVSLRDRGLAELENERPQEAAALYLQLVGLVPSDPLGYGNLAIALLRQQQYDGALAAIEAALKNAPGRGDLLAIKGEILQWTGDLEGAVDTLARAAKASPQDIEILYALLNQATNANRETETRTALFALAQLRPENVVVLLQLGRDAIARGDRAAASTIFLRLNELLWQAQPLASRAMTMVTEALAGDDLAKARVPALRFENVLKVSPMFRESLRELRTGIQGIPIARFLDEPPVKQFGNALRITFRGVEIDPRPTRGGALAHGDFDGDQRPDLARIRAAKPPGQGDRNDQLEIRLAAGDWQESSMLPVPGFTSTSKMAAFDVNNDGHLDLIAVGEEGSRAWRGIGDGTFEPVADNFGLADVSATAIDAIDFDIEGDLDFAFAGPTGAKLWRNSLEGPLDSVSAMALPSAPRHKLTAVVASDLDRDGDLDLALGGHDSGIAWLDNLRQGRFTTREGVGLPSEGTARDLEATDLDNDGWPDLIVTGRGLAAWHNDGGRFSPWTLLGLPGPTTPLQASVALDADNDGRLDLATVGDGGLAVYTQAARRFSSQAVVDGPKRARALVTADLDGDGDLDIVTAGPDGLHRLTNDGGNQNAWLAVRLRGLVKGNSKNNVLGVGSVVEVKTGQAYQFREARGDVVHFGLGAQPKAEVLRVVWTNGVPQNRLQVEGKQQLVEEQLLKGSCPFVYGWDGERIAFVSDLLWGAPIGLPVAPGVFASADPDELVRLDGIQPRADGRYDLRVTEELWEAAFFDYLRLWVVDHPDDVETASNLRIVPGAGPQPDRVLGTRGLQAPVGAWDANGRDVTAIVATRDDRYADGYSKSPYQGVAAEPWSLTFDLGGAPAEPLRLHLDGWIFPADASLNLAVAQREDLNPHPPKLEVETADGWQILMPNMGHPAGKTKTMVVDTPPLPPGAKRLRIVTGQWLHWDRIAWSTTTADEAPIVVARLAPTVANLRRRGYSAPIRRAPNAPHDFDYAVVRDDAPWTPFPGRYTRLGDVRPLLDAVDDRSVILAAGDEIALRFDATGLPPLREGWRRTVFLESHGWDKDADRNTGEGQHVAPLPFRAMKAYPFAEGEAFPTTPEYRAYIDQWLTREITNDRRPPNRVEDASLVEATEE